MLTIEAFLLRRKCGTASRVQLNCPVRQISTQRSQSSGLMSSIFAVGPATPALLTSTSSPPSFAIASENRAFTAVRSETSQGVAVMAGSLAASSDKAVLSTSQVWTLAPSAANRRAIASPMPPAPAVTSTRKPLISRSMIAPNGCLKILVGETAARQDEFGLTADIGGNPLARRSGIAGGDRVAHIGMRLDRVAFRQPLGIGAQIEIDHRPGLQPQRADDLDQDRRMRRLIDRKVEGLVELDGARQVGA